jgi:hypothetical protein
VASPETRNLRACRSPHAAIGSRNDGSSLFNMRFELCALEARQTAAA